MTKERKKELLKLLKTLSDENIAELIGIIEESEKEDSNIEELIASAVENNQLELLDELVAYINESNIKLRKSEEASEKEGEEEDLEHFFDNA